MDVILVVVDDFTSVKLLLLLGGDAAVGDLTLNRHEGFAAVADCFEKSTAAGARPAEDEQHLARAQMVCDRVDEGSVSLLLHPERGGDE